MMLSHARQFYCGRLIQANPNWREAQREQHRLLSATPNLRSQGGRRAFMNTAIRRRPPAR